MKWIVMLLALIPATVFAGSKEVMNASCKITTDRASGSGIVFKRDDKCYYIVTAGHVVSDANTYKVQFYRKGTISSFIDAKLVMISFIAGTTKDIAVLSIDSKVGNIQPIPIVPRTYSPKVNDFIYGAGCPEGKWLQYWEGAITAVSDTISFNMPPIGGQSGSGVVVSINNKDYVLGLVNWRIESAVKYGSGVLIRNFDKTVKVSHIPVAKEWSVQDIVNDINRCENCGLYKSQHYARLNPETNQYDIHCPKCPTHGLRFKDHLIKGMKVQEFCGPEGCFPFPDSGVKPNNNFDFDDSEKNEDIESPKNDELKNQIEELLGKLGILQQDNQELKDGQTTDRAKFSIGGFLLGILSSFLTKRFGRLPAKLILWAAKKQGKKVIENFKTIPEVVEKTKTVEQITDVAPQTQEAKSVVNNIYVSNEKVAPYIKEFFDHKVKDGEKIEDWALFGTLYKEAVDLLRTGRLFFNEKDGVVLQGQAKTADIIDNWVHREFIRRSTIQQITSNIAYNEAMTGFLYKEAISELRKGSFGVLGAEETANVIDRWVNTEFIKRLNIK